MHLLPHDINSAVYWRELYKQPLPFWQGALQRIAELHNLPAGSWTRAGLGRNIVFLTPALVVKLGPPCWPSEMKREAAALNFVAGRLPVSTPVFVATGTLDGWDYLVQERLPGTDLWELWPQLDGKTRLGIAHQHGEVMAALHALPLHDVPAILHFDWEGMLAMQHEECTREMAAAGVDAALVDQVEPYLAATPWHIEKEDRALIHGDLSRPNFLFSEVGGQWTITGLIDWGDIKIGPPSHEFISPGMHMYRGDRAALRRWYEGYSLLDRDRVTALQHVIMARAMLYYPDNFANFIEKFPGAAACSNWPALSSAFWHMDTEEAKE